MMPEALREVSVSVLDRHYIRCVISDQSILAAAKDLGSMALQIGGRSTVSGVGFVRRLGRPLGEVLVPARDLEINHSWILPTSNLVYANFWPEFFICCGVPKESATSAATMILDAISLQDASSPIVQINDYRGDAAAADPELLMRIMSTLNVVSVSIEGLMERLERIEAHVSTIRAFQQASPQPERSQQTSTEVKKLAGRLYARAKQLEEEESTAHRYRS